MKRAFTLIELLVVIAIIAILAAILFPVFAQAKVMAKKTSDLSNNKQINLASMMYATDSDDLYPMQTGTNTAGAWGYGEGQMFIPWNWTTLGVTTNWPLWSEGMANNTIQPYAKNNQIMGSPGGTTDPYGAGHGSGIPAGYTPLKMTYTYNGLMSSYNSSGMPSATTVPIWWAGMGNGSFNGWSLPTPQLICEVANSPCTYIPYSPSCSANAATQNGSTGLMYGTSLSMWLFNNGQNWAYGDGHAKYRKLGNTSSMTNYNTEPFTSYTSLGAPGGSYWWDGCHAWLFRPDYVPANGFN